MLGFWFQLAGMMSFGVSNCLWKFPLRTLPVPMLISLRSATTSVLFFLLILGYHFGFASNESKFYYPISDLHISGILPAIGLCAINYWGLYFFNLSMKHTASGIAITTATSGALISIVIGIYFYGEKFTLGNGLNFLVYLLAIWFLENLSKSALKLQFTRGMLYALLSMVFWRTASFFPMATAQVGILWFCLILELTVCFLSTAIFLLSERCIFPYYKYSLKGNYSWILLLAIFGFGGVLFANTAMNYSAISALALLGIAQPLTSWIFGAVFLKERLTTLQYIGMAIMLSGILWQTIQF